MSFISKWHDTEKLGLLMLGLFGMLLTWSEFWRGEIFSAPVLGFSGLSFWPVLVAVAVAFLMLVNIYRGHVGIGVTFCFLLACRYFFDHFFGYMIKAWGFSFTGIVFMAAGLFFGRLRKFFEPVHETVYGRKEMPANTEQNCVYTQKTLHTQFFQQDDDE